MAPAQFELPGAVDNNPQEVAVMAKNTSRRVTIGLSHNYGRRLTIPQPDHLERMGARITPQPNGCWAWDNDLTRYGEVQWGRGVDGQRVSEKAHRAVYEVLVDRIPDGCHLHHECQNPGCVNPEHLLPLTHAEHMARHAELRRAV